MYVPEHELTTKAGWLVEALLYFLSPGLVQVTDVLLVASLYCDVQSTHIPQHLVLHGDWCL